MKIDDVRQLQISEFDYNLLDDKIAKYPLLERDLSKLLIYRNSNICCDRFYNLLDHLPSDSLLLFNNTRVIHARLLFKKKSGADIEIFCLAPNSPEEYEANFIQRGSCSWNCMVGNAKRWRDEELSMEVSINGVVVTLKAEKLNRSGNGTVVQFKWNNDMFTFSELLEVAGSLPIPPYLKRAAEKKDDKTYQTVYSYVDGSVAAPTAGLHFTPKLMEQIRSKGLNSAEVTLHVGAGTFRPIKSSAIVDHQMHSEFISLPKNTIEKILNHQGKLIVIGTTSMRAVESLYYIGSKLMAKPERDRLELGVDQWEPYLGEYSMNSGWRVEPKKVLSFLLEQMEKRGEEELTAATSLLIAPGFKFNFSDALITNFHQPKSSLLLLVAAFVGEEWRKIYSYAVKNDFRFLSYGDSSLLWRNGL